MNTSAHGEAAYSQHQRRARSPSDRFLFVAERELETAGPFDHRRHFSPHTAWTGRPRFNTDIWETQQPSEHKYHPSPSPEPHSPKTTPGPARTASPIVKTEIGHDSESWHSRDSQTPVRENSPSDPDHSVRARAHPRPNSVGAAHADVLAEVHDICLQATRAYLVTHAINSQVRNRQPPRSSYADVVVGRHVPVPEATECLLLNISNICSVLWSRSQNERASLPGAERVAIENMGFLVEWAETVVLGQTDEWEDASDEEDVRQAMVAARNLCAWLGDREGLCVLDDLHDELLADDH